MTRRSTILTFGGGCILALTFRSATHTTGFVSTRVQPLKTLDLQSTARKGRQSASLSASRDPENANRSDAVPSSSSVFLGSLVGLAFAGASLGTRNRQCKVAARCGEEKEKESRGGSFAWIFGGDGPPKAPSWIKKKRVPGEKSKGKRVVPAWLNLKKWETFSAQNKARGVRWWIQAHDEDGNPAWDKKADYPLETALDILLGMNARAPSTFDCSVELAMMMKLDPKFPDQQIRFSVSLPHGTGKVVRVAVFCPPDEEDEVMALGAHLCGKALADEIASEQFQFDVLIAKPAMMPQLAKLGKILGPRRLMPSPKSGTVVTDYEKAIKDFQSGTTELRNDRNSQVQCIVGKLSFGKQKLMENIQSLLDQMVEKRPAGAKQTYWKQIFVGATQSPSIRISSEAFPKIPMN